MSVRSAPVVVVLALLGLPACLDPIVGGECQPGFSPCHGVCLATGTCLTIDASSEANPVVIDGAENQPRVDGDDLDGGGLDADDLDGGGASDDGGSTDDSAPAFIDAWSVDGAGSEARKDADAKLVDSTPRRDVTDPPDAVDAPLPDDVLPDDVLPDDVLPDDAPLAGDLPVTLSDAGIDGDDDAEATDGECPGCLDGASAADTEPADGTEDDGGATEDAIAEPDGPLVCTETELICSDQCIDPMLDPENCGDCNTICATGVCIDGGCLVCDADESVCGRQCINLSTDPDNCGGCGIPCASGLCSNGRCEAAGTGRAIVIGHDYYKNRPAMNRILGNAVFLWPTNPVRLLAYVGDADPIAVNGANGAIQQVATATGRQPAVTIASSSDEVPSALATTDVLLVYGQAQADDGKLAQLGESWASALASFLQTGGTVIILDAVYATNNGTVQILSQAGLFDITRDTSSTGHVCSVIAHGDALASGLLRTYLCEPNSTSFTIADTATTITPVVGDGVATVVVHKIF
jgi:hypothetical protein